MALKIEAKIVNVTRDDTKLLYDLELNPLPTYYTSFGEDVEVALEVDRTRDNERIHSSLVTQLASILGSAPYSLSPAPTSQEILIRGFGRKGLNYRRDLTGTAFEADTDYFVDDVVLFEGQSYICLQEYKSPLSPTDADEPDQATAYWAEVSNRPPRWRGNWSTTPEGEVTDPVKKAKYFKADVVRFGNDKNQYICMNKHNPAGSGDNPNNSVYDSTTNPSGKWALFVEKGTDGAKGDTGDKGDQGDSGDYNTVAYKGDGLRPKRIPKNQHNAGSAPTLASLSNGTTGATGRVLLPQTVETMKIPSTGFANLVVTVRFVGTTKEANGIMDSDKLTLYLVAVDGEDELKHDTKTQIGFAYAIVAAGEVISLGKVVESISLASNTWLTTGRTNNKVTMGLVLCRTVHPTAVNMKDAGKIARVTYTLE